MKKVLFATTALVASAGIAAAADEGVALKGSAEMGIFGGTGTDLQFHTDIDVGFTLASETDNGLSFGASVDLDEGGDGSAANDDDTDDGGATIFISGDFGTVTMGDTDGAFDWALQETLAAGGSINDAEESAGYNGNSGLDGNFDGQIVRYDHSIGDFSFAVSAEIDDAGVEDPIFGLGVKYTAQLSGATLGFGVGYQTGEADVLAVVGGLLTLVPGGDADVFGVSVDAKLDNGLRAILNYSDLDGDGGFDNHWGIGVGYETGAWAFGVNYGIFESASAARADSEGFGLAVSYDLGGGAEIQFGYGSSKSEASGDDFTANSVSTDSYSLGVSMSF